MFLLSCRRIVRESHRLPAHSIPSFLGHNNVRAQKGGTALTATINCTAQTKGQQPTANSQQQREKLVRRLFQGQAQEQPPPTTITTPTTPPYKDPDPIPRPEQSGHDKSIIPKGAHLKETYRTPSPWLRAENDRATKHSTVQGAVQGGPIP